MGHNKWDIIDRPYCRAKIKPGGPKVFGGAGQRLPVNLALHANYNTAQAIRLNLTFLCSFICLLTNFNQGVSVQ